ncbi:exonuclease SbcCD, D subunit / type 5 capsule protein repressor, C-terminal domain multi-domain protein [Lachnoanaerobaculum saburreum F0468]|uniref:Nuclease SbcCD subunit D n=1 Tax=Lachnoanaerobaculum saburreum F0468 TaxID=1095750 RepID=I0R8B6_9FIRM|nr:exonuclease SbcCD subunit D [Lachnoanaerobaculum saburreum]EIC95924.1 exonuclease SbcCD, D subunit / type 5 capsule protein repressor, C-terminal domain multi-domain protein [Lachnoanaerobaculum saburreum F0468]
MKIMHLSDLHLGKRVNEFSMLEDQIYILNEIINIIDEQKPKVIILAGDIYDKPIPPAEAVEIFDDFLYKLSKRNLYVFIISGNHDSAERIAFGSRLFDKSGIYLSPVYNGKISPICIDDKYGKVNFYMLPFIKPVHVRRFFPDAEIYTYTDALSTVISDMHIDTAQKNILITHQFVTGSSRTESEDVSVGGSDNVDSDIFKDFDYVALGHIHRSQCCDSEYIRYCGTPLKYSFSESKDIKSITMLDIKEKGNIKLDFIPLTPLRDMVEIKGSYNELMLKSFYENTSLTDDYVHITLTDEEDIPDVITKLRVVYKNIMKLDYDNQRTKKSSEINPINDMDSKSPLELFDTFYELQNGKHLSDTQRVFLKNIIEEIWEYK